MSVNKKFPSIEEILKDQGRNLRVRVVAGSSGLERLVRQKDLHRPGLALSGFTELFPHERIQVLGETEMLFLKQLGKENRRAALERLFNLDIPCILITGKKRVFPLMKEFADKNSIPVLSTSLSEVEASFLLSNYLNVRFAATTNIHGTLVDVYGTGLLFIGRAGIGKSEIALDLVERGHRLVADDIVTLIRKPPGVLIGGGPELLKHMIEIRGVGVLNVREMFGVRAIRLQKRVETVVELEDWDGKEDYERLGLEEKFSNYLDMQIPLISLPIYPGKNITVITETIALNHHLKIYGFNAARQLSDRQQARMRDKKRISDYLKWDDE